MLIKYTEENIERYQSLQKVLKATWRRKNRKQNERIQEIETNFESNN